MKNKLLSILLFFIPFCLYARPKGTDFTMQVCYTIYADSTCNRILFKTALPQSVPGIQQIKSVTFSRQPDSVYICDGIKFAMYDLQQPASYGEISIKVKGTIFANDYKTQCKKHSAKVMKDLSAWLKAEHDIDSDSAEIRQKADSLKGATQEQTLKNIFTYVQNNFHYTPNDNNIGALGMLRRKYGDCTEFTDLFVALCRASGIPARHVYGVTAYSSSKGTQHSWAEVWLPQCGWTSFDPTPGNYATFSTLDQSYILFSLVRNNKELENKWLFWTFRYWGKQMPQIQTDYLIFR